MISRRVFRAITIVLVFAAVGTVLAVMGTQMVIGEAGKHDAATQFALLTGYLRAVGLALAGIGTAALAALSGDR